MLADEAIHLGQEHAQVRMRVVPADDLQICRQGRLLTCELGPRFVRKLETARRALMVLSPQRIGDDDERPAPIVLILPSQHHAAQFDARIRQGVSFQVAQRVQIDKDR